MPTKPTNPAPLASSGDDPPSDFFCDQATPDANRGNPTQPPDVDTEDEPSPEPPPEQVDKPNLAHGVQASVDVWQQTDEPDTEGLDKHDLVLNEDSLVDSEAGMAGGRKTNIPPQEI